MVEEVTTEVIVNVTRKPKNINVFLNGKKLKEATAQSLEAYNQNQNICFYDEVPELNLYATPDTEFALTSIHKNPQIRIKIDKTNITTDQIRISIPDFEYNMNEDFCSHTGVLTAPVAQIKAEDIEPYCLKPSWEPVENADYYEIMFQNQLYSKIQNSYLTFNELDAESNYTFKVRAVNQNGCSDWTECGATTLNNPLEFAIKGIKGKGSLKAYEDFEERRLFDFATGGDIWYTDTIQPGIPFELIMNLGSVNTLDKLVYLPRSNAGTGTLLGGSIATSLDKEHWTEAGEFTWERNTEDKTFVLLTTL